MNIKKNKSLLLTLVLTGFSVFLSVLRCLYTGSAGFVFLNWNLFLAALPVLFAWLLSRFRQKLVRAILLLLWFVFLPNSLYILTDFIHLGRYRYAPTWFDFILILSYAICGLLYAYTSIKLVENCYCLRISAKKRVFLCVLLFFICAFGIYLGRFLRWNSWDLFTRPHLVFGDIFALFVNPLQNAGVWVFTFLLGTLFSIFYFTCTSLDKSRS